MNFGSRMNASAQMQANSQVPDFGIDDENDPFAVRQESRSLMEASELQVQEGVDASIFEEVVDFTPYLADDDGSYIDPNSDFLEPMLQKQHAIYSDISVQQSLVLDNPPNYTTLANCDNPMDVPSGMNDRSEYRPQMFNYQPIKEERDWDEEQDMDSSVPGTSRVTDSIEIVDMPRNESEFDAKPRKYNLKPDAVKKTVKYLDARKRNNIAVRKSRNKQKELQAKKEKKLRDLESAIEDLDDKLKEERQCHAALKAQYSALQKSDKKTVEENRRLRAEIEHLKNEVERLGNQLSSRGAAPVYRYK